MLQNQDVWGLAKAKMQGGDCGHLCKCALELSKKHRSASTHDTDRTTVPTLLNRYNDIVVKDYMFHCTESKRSKS